jgi:cobalamin biosynthesis Mg chelatase CobN
LNILRDMQTAGYHLDYLPESGQQLIEDIISKVTNDRRWSSPEQMAAKAVDKVSPQLSTLVRRTTRFGSNCHDQTMGRTSGETI